MRKNQAVSIEAQAVNSLVLGLQQMFVIELNKLSGSSAFVAKEWFRDEGRHGGGIRYVSVNEQLFNRASVNVSQVHYADIVSNDLASATAISSIIHPHNPYIPSIHIHICWTEMKNAKGCWRMMADLNPAIENNSATTLFKDHLKKVAYKQYKLASAQGDQYFYIPALKRHRGVAHFYLEGYNSGNIALDTQLARSFGQAVIDCYLSIFLKAIEDFPNPQAKDYQKQLAYHTLYLFQVLTLDKGTSSGLLAHNQNDLGILGSLPAQIDKALLANWKSQLIAPQQQLLLAILKVLPDESPCLISEKVKLALANVVRQYYSKSY